jgi:uridine kinase
MTSSSSISPRCGTLEAVDSPVYDFSIHNRSDETTRVEPAPVIIVEGILIFAEPRICQLLDIKLFVDTDADVRLLRRIKRDVVDRGRTLQSVEDQYLGTVKPMHELYVEPSKRNADLIIPDGGHNIVAMDMILNRIQRGVGLTLSRRADGNSSCWSRTTEIGCEVVSVPRVLSSYGRRPSTGTSVGFRIR